MSATRTPAFPGTAEVAPGTKCRTSGSLGVSECVGSLRREPINTVYLASYCLSEDSAILLLCRSVVKTTVPGSGPGRDKLSHLGKSQMARVWEFAAAAAHHPSSQCKTSSSRTNFRGIISKKYDSFPHFL
jgi:hypothetical protein